MPVMVQSNFMFVTYSNVELLRDYHETKRSRSSFIILGRKNNLIGREVSHLVKVSCDESFLAHLSYLDLGLDVVCLFWMNGYTFDHTIAITTNDRTHTR